MKYIEVTEAGHPVPDENGFKATGELLKIAELANCNDLVICLISGGGSSLLPDIPEGCLPEDMMKLNALLINSGACISEINAVRKHLSAIKGGQLARVVYPATLVNLILSDVPGDPFDVIASGPNDISAGINRSGDIWINTFGTPWSNDFFKRRSHWKEAGNPKTG